MTSPGYPHLHDSHDQRQPPLAPGDVLAGKYRMEEVVGAGAMGVVVRAWHIELEQPVAVKFLYPEYARNSDGAERFRREARSAAKIKNQHVTRVLDVGTLEGKNIPYIVMEYLEGHDLAREIRERGAVPVAVAVRYVMQACEAVAEAHERGIVHRDLKPANLFVAEGTHGERMIKVLDFGISKINGVGGAQQFSLTDTATLMGSPAYMSPEQLESSRNVDGRADIWSLGVILHELIMGQVPFTGEGVPQLVRAILSGTRESLVQRDPSLAALEAVVARCLCQERAQRFDSILDLQEALRPFASLVLPGDPSLSMMASRQIPIPLLHGGVPSLMGSLNGSLGAASVSGKASIPGNSPAGTSVPVLQSQGRGTNGVASAWGNTQRGRHRSWQRHGLPLALLIVLFGLGAYWVSEQISASAPVVPTEGHLANSPASARPNTPAPGAQPIAAAPLPSLAKEAAASPAVHPAVTGAGSPSTASPSTGSSLTPGVRPTQSRGTSPEGTARAEAGLPTAPKPATSGPKVAPVLPTAAATSAAPRATATKPSTPRSAEGDHASEPSLRSTPRTTDGDMSDKPKSDTSSRGIPEVPDFGGRE